uniref:Uncharacterized protein n=1 Tax=Corethron hystrix TaxID=216773 RepID=A0A7S1FP07_9STRA|mmetsp:Transcript_17075/g.38417  ORF Transcript_17075/g.38417 Transcript_17075/m.38417 type:complete len:268 (+) Transcript_17075:195-998(+)|eukprot:CAMPEP_0113309828 /NCGR_PEP_ID=MMETSP0010_2-20120614/7714_1 /TAXON_ID=216773 ORGANISM="Corethron hystrix, Strain 308" /NCGR_SAMPLE_ID=MMETSP0010_2 /ASSEMBLY_ACC=CAM_ASM_000155 /LENGTH=267 /DNA_ID=CAMNT_0000165155 /DNA_START=183 /DNA_END=986 /DNA_ORIENTATION=+ /assembly_acc=CAM_ASM_000155
MNFLRLLYLQALLVAPVQSKSPLDLSEFDKIRVTEASNLGDSLITLENVHLNNINNQWESNRESNRKNPQAYAPYVVCNSSDKDGYQRWLDVSHELELEEEDNNYAFHNTEEVTCFELLSEYGPAYKTMLDSTNEISVTPMYSKMKMPKGTIDPPAPLYRIGICSIGVCRKSRGGKLRKLKRTIKKDINNALLDSECKDNAINQHIGEWGCDASEDNKAFINLHVEDGGMPQDCMDLLLTSITDHNLVCDVTRSDPFTIGLGGDLGP